MLTDFNNPHFLLFCVFCLAVVVVFAILIYRLLRLRQLKRWGVEFIWTLVSLLVLIGLTAPAIYAFFHSTG